MGVFFSLAAGISGLLDVFFSGRNRIGRKGLRQVSLHERTNERGNDVIGMRSQMRGYGSACVFFVGFK